jgi:hypothetical protein
MRRLMKKSKLKISDLNEISYTEFILSIDVRSISGKIAFSMVKSCKNKDYTKDNAAIAWKNLKTNMGQPQHLL